MTENPSAEFDIFDWIETGTVARKSVTIYNDPAAAAEFEALDAELVKVQARKKAGAAEEAVGERDEETVLLEQLGALYDRWQASKAVWTVRALSDEFVKQVLLAHPDPVRPDIPKDLPADERASLLRAFQAELAAVTDERNLSYIAEAVVSVETAMGTATAVSVDALRKMKSRPHGATRLNLLLKAVEQATAGDVELPAPKSPGASNGSQG